METTDDLRIGQVVKSKVGRDKGKIFTITQILDDKYVIICDGDIRKISKPKKKKVKHLIIYNTVFEELEKKVYNNEKITNAFVRRLLKPFNNKI